ncbi:citrate transporter [Nitzschia inconspicua]|uniref:Citrate transporter n=1 Tax=Nitzschia inconspicua TaxID=303405 RepID=A0A9K3L7X5_9STRA|nr:citrate transporter [Nitzschia inconspicua]
MTTSMRTPISFSMTTSTLMLMLPFLFQYLDPSSVMVANAFINTPTSPLIFSSRINTSARSPSLFLQPTKVHNRKHSNTCSNKNKNNNSNHFPRLSSSTTPTASSSELQGSTVDPEDVLPLASNSITPEGYGFSSPVSRILKLTTNGNYFKAMATDSVTDVMGGITEGVTTDAALVFSSSDDDKLIGIFTETDYIKFSMERAKASSTEEESAAYLVQAKIEDYVTPAEKIVALSLSDTANVAIAAMKQNRIRHLVVVDEPVQNNRIAPTSNIVGLLSMQDIMNVIQKDERLTLQSLQAKYPGISSPIERMREQLKSNANAKARDSPEQVKTDIIRAGTAALGLASLALFFSESEWLHDHADWAMIGIFVLGYVGIIFEEVFEFNKAAVALLMSTGLWVTYADYFDSTSGVASDNVIEQLGEQLAEVSDICFFLLAASTIVEVVDAHQGFKVVTNQIKTTSKKGLFWTIGFLTFFLSAILNNLTVTIVMCSLLKKLVPNETDRKLFGAMVVVAANAGGVWTPIGDVTTTMLWINNQLSTLPTITELFLPSLVCLIASLAFLVNQVEEDDVLEKNSLPEPSELAPRGKLVFWSGIAALLSVPIFAELTGLPPYLAMLTGLGAIWTLTDVIHMGEDGDEDLKVPQALAKLDTAGILFFLGILMSIGVLDKSGLLKELAVFLSNNLPSLDIIATVIGLASALIDNVPLVAATMGMYDIADYATDDRLWQLIALCAGTGGSILVIGSASGVALMGLEKVDFLWYAKKVSIGATVGYFAGIATYLLENAILSGSLVGNLLPQAAVAADIASSAM